MSTYWSIESQFVVTLTCSHTSLRMYNLAIFFLRNQISHINDFLILVSSLEVQFL